MKRVCGTILGLCVGAAFGWFILGSIPGTLGIGMSLAAASFGALSRPTF